MEDVVYLFAERLIEDGIIDHARARQLRETCGDSFDVVNFGESLLEDCPDQLDRVQKILDDTVDEFAAGRRAKTDPFEAPVPPPAPHAGEPRRSIPYPPAAKPLPLPSRPVAAAPAAPAAPAPAAPAPAPVAPERESASESPHGSSELTPSGRGSELPPETVIATAGATAGVPDFTRLDHRDVPGIAAALIGLLLYLGEHGFSDLHLSGGSRPFVRKCGKLEYLAGAPLPEPVAASLATALLSPEQRAYFEAVQDYDFAIALDNGSRYRTNLMQHRDGVKITFRFVPRKIHTLEDLGFGAHVETLRNLLSYHNGLILVTGPVGCGKTTTLAAMVDALNKTRTDHIICVEDPIEIVHRSQQCVVTQRGVGPHTRSFRSALKGALRQDPDVIVIGEMRSLETIEMAISASETGHLVIGTMHTSDAAMTLNRLLDVFPPAAQSQIRSMVAESLRGIVCQRLLPGLGGESVLACEILVKNTAVAALIREGKQAGLGNIMETGKRDGMVLMDASVWELYQKGAISAETARSNIRNEILRRRIT